MKEIIIKGAISNTHDLYFTTEIKKYFFGLIKLRKTTFLEPPRTVGLVVLMTEHKLIVGGIYSDENNILWQATEPYALRNCNFNFGVIYNQPERVVLLSMPFEEGV